jgi:hypothetical protein
VLGAHPRETFEQAFAQLDEAGSESEPSS